MARSLEDYVMTYASSADILHDDDLAGVYSFNRSEFILHRNFPSAITLTVQTLYPKTLKDFGREVIKEEIVSNATGDGGPNQATSGDAPQSDPPKKPSSGSQPKPPPKTASFRTRIVYHPSKSRSEIYARHPVRSTNQWSTIDDQMEIPLEMSFKDSQHCADRPLVILVAHYKGYHKMAQLRRSPT